MDTRFLSPTPPPTRSAGASGALAPAPARRSRRRAAAPPPLFAHPDAPDIKAATPAPAPAAAPDDGLRAVAVVVEPLPLWLAVRADPTLARAPLIVHDEGRVVHANAVARRLGITQGMRLDGAHLRAPGLEARACPEPDLAQGWRAVVRELAGWTPWLEADRRGRAFLRLTPLEAEELAARLAARVGVADDLETAELAALAGRPGEARTVPAGAGDGFLARLPLRFLRGVGLPERDLTRLQWLGLATVGDLGRWTPDQRRAYLGDVADVLAPYLAGPRRRTVAAWRPPRVLRRALAFERPLFEPGELEPALDRLARSLALDLDGRAARHLTVATEGGGGARQATRVAKRPLHQAGQIRQQALFALRDSGAAAGGVEALAIELAEPERLADAVGLWDARAHRERAVDAVLERHPRALVRVRWGDPHAPAADLAWGWAALEDAARPMAGASATARAAAATATAADRAATTPARRALEAPTGAVAPADRHAAPPLLAHPERPPVDAPVAIPAPERPDRPLTPAEGERWAARRAGRGPVAPSPLPSPSPLPTPLDPLRDPDLQRAERWPGERRAA